MKKRIKKLLSFALGLTIAALPVAAVTPVKAEKVYNDLYWGPEERGLASEGEWDVLRRTNKLRLSLNKEPLTTFFDLQIIAGQRAEELLEKYDHYRPDGSLCFTAATDVGYWYTAIAENICMNAWNAETAVRLWTNSPGHYQNMIDSGLYHMAVGQSYGLSSEYNFETTGWVQFFLTNSCSYSAMALSNTSVTGTRGEEIDDLGLVVMEQCRVHGVTFMPLISEMCSGYDPNKTGTQTVTVKAHGMKQTLTVTIPEENHTIIFDANGGYGAPEAVTFGDGAVVTIGSAAPTRDGYKFLGWAGSSTAVEPEIQAGDVYTVSGDVTLYAVWGSIPVYTLTYDANGGYGGPGKQECREGEEYSFSSAIPVRNGYTFLGWSSDPAAVAVDVDTEQRFYISDGDVTIYAVWEKNKDVPVTVNFADVSAGSYYYEAVQWAVASNVTSGIGNGLFGPKGSCTRAQAVSFLWRLAGSPKVGSGAPFADVRSDAYYADAVRWAVSEGITQGTSNTTFSPNKNVTREEFTTFLWRAKGRPTAGSTTSFSDVPQTRFSAVAIAWAYSQGIVSGTSQTTFAPNKDCNRADAVTILMRAYGGQ